VSGHYERRYLGLVAKLASLQVDLELQAAAANTVLYVMDDAIQKPALALEKETGTTTVQKAFLGSAFF
jgi:hypothetical protein